MPKGAPQVTITYCKPCGYAKRATEAATALREALGVESKLVPGTGGVFEVSVGREVVAKRTRTEFPSASDIVLAVRTRLAG